RGSTACSPRVTHGPDSGSAPLDTAQAIGDRGGRVNGWSKSGHAHAGTRVQGTHSVRTGRARWPDAGLHLKGRAWHLRTATRHSRADRGRLGLARRLLLPNGPGVRVRLDLSVPPEAVEPAGRDAQERPSGGQHPPDWDLASPSRYRAGRP